MKLWVAAIISFNGLRVLKVFFFSRIRLFKESKEHEESGTREDITSICPRTSCVNVIIILFVSLSPPEPHLEAFHSTTDNNNGITMQCEVYDIQDGNEDSTLPRNGVYIHEDYHEEGVRNEDDVYITQM